MSIRKKKQFNRKLEYGQDLQKEESGEQMKRSSNSLVVKKISIQMTTDIISYLSEDHRFKSEKVKNWKDVE